jgi:hypothetical protein
MVCLLFFHEVYLLSPSDYYRILDESQTLHKPSPTTLTPESSSNDAGTLNSTTKHYCFASPTQTSIGLDDSPTAKLLFSRRSFSQGSCTQRRSSKYFDINLTFTTLICLLYLENIDLDLYMIPVTKCYARKKSTLDLLVDLDSRTGVGLNPLQFANLFSRCSCGRIMIKRAFIYHECLDVIDLTIDED